MAKVNKTELEQLRGIDAAAILPRLVDYAKADPSFVPISGEPTTRWHVTAQGRNFELLLTGPKFYDTRQKRGGGGAIDLVMHLYQIDFKKAVDRLRGSL
ncbi:MAG: hypothetical protein E6Q42_14475 [Dechloromonas sp.]|nr:MAG: hypothetical protein E6Q42_14475 [Dechloromonas sp.]